MTVGQGIAILGIWLFAAVAANSRVVTGFGFVIAVAAALIATFGIVK